MDAEDAFAIEERRKFKLRALLLWCVHDFPTYALASGQVTKGFRDCLECGPIVTTRRSIAVGKNQGHRRYLRRNHRYRCMKRAFDMHDEVHMDP